MFDRIWWALIGLFIIAVINLYLIVKATEQQMPQAPQTNQQGPLAKAMPGQAAIADQFQNQAKPFGWLVDMINHITGAAPTTGQGTNPAPTNTPQPAGTTDKKAPGKQGADQGAGQPQPGGMVEPGQVPDLANVMAPNAGQNVTQLMGLMPQTQGSFGWLLQMLQQQQMKQQQAQGGDLVSLVGQMVGAPSGASGASTGSGGTAGAGAGGASAGTAGG